MKKPRKPGPNKLPFVPWWYHPNARYEGRHRGRYQYSVPNPSTVMALGDKYIQLYVYGNMVNGPATAYRMDENGHLTPQPMPNSQTIGFGLSPEDAVLQHHTNRSPCFVVPLAPEDEPDDYDGYIGGVCGP